MKDSLNKKTSIQISEETYEKDQKISMLKNLVIEIAAFKYYAIL